jgi:voltage-gated sodium channel
MQRWGPLLLARQFVMQTVFVAEMVIRVAAHESRQRSLLRDWWNESDSAVVSISLPGVAGSCATVARLARALRVARFV